MKQKGMIVKIVLCVLLLSTLCGFKLFPRDINIIFTSDVHSTMNNSMNYASVKRFKDILKQKSSYVTLIDGGDYSLDGGLGDDSKGEAIIEIMNDIGYDIATLGNHEFDKGIDVAKKNIDDANFDIIGCNIRYTGDKEDPFTNVKPYVVKKYGSTKVAYVGILTPDTTMSNKKSYRNCQENGKVVVDFYANPNDPDEDGSKIYDVIQSTVDEARQKANYVVAVAHIGINSNPVINSYDLASYTHGIDIILDAHSHKEVDERLTNNEGKSVVLFAVGKEMEKIGHIAIKTNGTIETEMVTDIERDPVVDSKIQTLIEKYAQIREEEEARQREIEEELQREQEKANLIKEKWNSLLKPKSYKESLEERINKNSEN